MNAGEQGPIETRMVKKWTRRAFLRALGGFGLGGAAGWIGKLACAAPAIEPRLEELAEKERRLLHELFGFGSNRGFGDGIGGQLGKLCDFDEWHFFSLSRLARILTSY